MVHKKAIEAIKNGKPRLSVKFFQQEFSGAEPVRDWLKSLPEDEKKAIGEDIKAVQFGWPLGLPLVDHLDGDIWEVRTKLENRIARVLFVVEEATIVLLHGFIKKDQKTPKQELNLAKDRLKKLRGTK
jgi:phage-related protein